MSHPNEPTRTSSPFEGQSAVIRPEPVTYGRIARWVIALAIIATVLSAGAYFAFKTIGDPMRTLPVFPADKYFLNPDSIAGSSYKAELRVDADINWQMGMGRLMAFSLTNEGNRLAVLVPANLAGAAFDKGQVYRVELIVEEGGLIRAKSFKKL